ncbi:MAG: hypothetical protein WC647_06370 [Desulfomonilaceae bacterium]|jgi:hypothetical protein
MDELESFVETHFVAISRGESIYIDLAEKAGIMPLDALDSMPSLLSSSWTEPEYFLAALGKDDISAIQEARSHFGLPPVE